MVIIWLILQEFMRSPDRILPTTGQTQQLSIIAPNYEHHQTSTRSHFSLGLGKISAIL
ncbi:hypothetical protein SPLC1_S080230 [Arthrospira platensis C1]|nr:hypothetical protein SPLC1_S080230 [Arthrospira platensis C1]